MLMSIVQVVCDFNNIEDDDWNSDNQWLSRFQSVNASQNIDRIGTEYS